MEEEQQEAQEFVPESMDQVPQDRVFCTVVLFLTPDNQIAGGLDYKGSVLSDVPASLGMECKLAADHLEHYIRKAIDHVSREGLALGQLMNLFGITEDDLEQNDDSDSTERSSTAASN